MILSFADKQIKHQKSPLTPEELEAFKKILNRVFQFCTSFRIDETGQLELEWIEKT